jgi:hypothetical protein
MLRKPRNRPDDPKPRCGRARPSQNESTVGVGGVSRTAHTPKRRPTELGPTRDNPLPEARKRASNAGEKQQSAKRSAHEDGVDERVGQSDAAHGKHWRPEKRRTRDGAPERSNESQPSNRRKQNDWRGDAAMPSTSQVPRSGWI